MTRNKLFNLLFVASAALFLAACNTGDSGQPETATLTVAIAGTGSGTVTSDVGDIDCSGADADVCSAEFNVDDATEVTLTATADAGSTFSGWSGDCTGMGDCVVTLTEDSNVTATFAVDSTDGGGGDVAEFTITDGANDAEELVNASTDDPTSFPAGHTYTHSSDLDIVYDASHGTVQVIGLRFTGVSIPDGATIDNAEIVFTAAATDAGTDGDLTVTIAGEDAAAPTPFEDDADGVGSTDLSTRAELATTANWDISGAWTPGETYATGDISAVLADMTLDGGDVVFLLSGANETEYRIAESAGTGRTGPTLRIEYTPADGGATAE